MLRDVFPKRVEHERGPTLSADHMFAPHDEQSCVHLLRDAGREARRGTLIHGDGNRAAKNATEERGNPFG
jgi:hypothetical protein